MKSKRTKGAKKQAASGPRISKWKLIAGFFVLCLLLSMCSGGGNKNKDDESKPVDEEQAVTEQVEEQAEEQEEEQEQKEETYEERHARYVENFINVYNANCSTPPLVFVEDYDLQDRDSGHYRVEYRLGAYKDKKGTFCTIGDNASMEILGSRVYIEGDTATVIQSALDIIKLFYPDISDESFDEIANAMSDPDERLFVDQAMSRADVYPATFQTKGETASFFVGGGIALDD